GRAVDRLVREAASPGLRGERDQVALPSEHVRERRAYGVDGAFEVDVEHLVEVLAREVEERPVGAHTRIRDHDVDSAEAFGRRVAELDERVEVADVTGTRDDAFEPEVAA